MTRTKALFLLGALAIFGVLAFMGLKGGSEVRHAVTADAEPEPAALPVAPPTTAHEAEPPTRHRWPDAGPRVVRPKVRGVRTEYRRKMVEEYLKQRVIAEELPASPEQPTDCCGGNRSGESHPASSKPSRSLCRRRLP